MPNAHASSESIEGLAGVVFRTDSRPGTAEEKALQAIQSDLSGGIVDLPDTTTLPHLRFAAAAVAGGASSHSIIELWVPADKQQDAAAQLTDAGYTVT